MPTLGNKNGLKQHNFTSQGTRTKSKVNGKKKIKFRVEETKKMKLRADSFNNEQTQHTLINFTHQKTKRTSRKPEIKKRYYN